MPFQVAMGFPINVGFSLVAWQCESNPWVKFERKSAGYVAQEASAKSEDRRPKAF